MARFRDLSPDERVNRSQMLMNLLHELSTNETLFSAEGDMIDNKGIEDLANKVEQIYKDKYRQRYSDLLQMLNQIAKVDGMYKSDLLTMNLENLAEYIRKSNKYDDDTFIGITKLTDHISLEFQRNRDYADLFKEIKRVEGEEKHLISIVENRAVSKVDALELQVKEARNSVQNSKIELVAILSIFAAIVIAFAGGLNYLGGAISISGSSELYSVSFTVLLCGILLLDIIAFLLYVVMKIIRLHEPRYVPDDEEGMFYRCVIRHAGVWFVIGFNIILLLAMAICAYNISII